jgi:hypothetical protein
MKKIVLTFGLIAGAIMAAMFLITIPFHEKIGLDAGLIIGYTSMVLAFLMIYFGVRTYRDNEAGGSIGFGRALGVGGLIALVATLCYVASWEVIYFNTKIGTEYIRGYQEHVLAQERASGATEQAIAAKRTELQAFAEDYNNPLVNAAYTFMEPAPVAIIMALVTALVLSRKKKTAAGSEDLAAQRMAVT